MAERITKVRECDRKFCRNRKGVAVYTLRLIPDMDESPISETEGELCPAHAEMARKFIANLFKNTKEYDDGKESET